MSLRVPVSLSPGFDGLTVDDSAAALLVETFVGATPETPLSYALFPLVLPLFIFLFDLVRRMSTPRRLACLELTIGAPGRGRGLSFDAVSSAGTRPGFTRNPIFVPAAFGADRWPWEQLGRQKSSRHDGYASS